MQALCFFPLALKLHSKNCSLSQSSASNSSELSGPGERERSFLQDRLKGICSCFGFRKAVQVVDIVLHIVVKMPGCGGDGAGAQREKAVAVADGVRWEQQ